MNICQKSSWKFFSKIKKSKRAGGDKALGSSSSGSSVKSFGKKIRENTDCNLCKNAVGIKIDCKDAEDLGNFPKDVLELWHCEYLYFFTTYNHSINRFLKRSNIISYLFAS